MLHLWMGPNSWSPQFFYHEHITSWMAYYLSKSLNRVINLYGCGDFSLRVILMDMEFKKLADNLRKMEFNIAEPWEHVGEVDRDINRVKDQEIYFISTIPYYCLPSQIIIHLMLFFIMWLDTLPVKIQSQWSTLHGIKLWDTIWTPRNTIRRCLYHMWRRTVTQK